MMADDATATVSDNNEPTDLIPKSSGISTSFTITFEDENENQTSKLRKNRNSNVFIRRHNRTLSLPIVNDRKLSKNSNDTHNFVEQKFGTVDKMQMNEEPTKFEGKLVNCDVKPAPDDDSDLPIERCGSSSSINCNNLSESKSDDGISDNDSEGGTYTLDKNNRQVQLARKSIDQVFGISSTNGNSEDVSIDCKVNNKSRMIDEWMEQSVAAHRSGDGVSNKSLVTANNFSKNKLSISKIPSPVISRRILQSETGSQSSFKMKSVSSPVEKKVYPTLEKIKASTKSRNSSSSEEIDTESYLKETENIVTALQNRIHGDLKQNKVMNRQEKDVNNLRRDRSKKGPSPAGTTAIPVRTKNVTTTTPSMKVRLSNGSNGFATPDSMKSLSTDMLRARKSLTCTSASSDLSNRVNERSTSKKPTYQRLKPNNASIRSNSSLSAQEIEFQNWKRRKNYDPLKAAAEDRKKKSTSQSFVRGGVSAGAISVERVKSTTKTTENEFCDKGIMRSASFHGLRNKNKFDRCAFSDDSSMINSSNSQFKSSSCLSNENSISSDIPDYDDDNDWVIPNPPSTSLQNTPPESVCSRLSLLSNAASCSSALITSSPLSKMNLATLAEVTRLSRVIKISISSLNNALKCENNKVNNRSKLIERSVSMTEAGVVDASKDVAEKKYSSTRNSISDEDFNHDFNDFDDDFSELSVSHQLKIASDNLKHIQFTIQELQLLYVSK